MSQYRLTLTDKQLSVLQQALDMYYRVGMGQTREVVEHLLPAGLDIDEFCKRRDAVEHHLIRAKIEAMPDLPTNAYHSIHSEKIDESNRVACDVYKVIRQHLAYERNPEGGFQVCFDPIYKQSDEPLPTIEKVK